MPEFQRPITLVGAGNKAANIENRSKTSGARPRTGLVYSACSATDRGCKECRSSQTLQDVMLRRNSEDSRRQPDQQNCGAACNPASKTCGAIRDC